MALVKEECHKEEQWQKPCCRLSLTRRCVHDFLSIDLHMQESRHSQIRLFPSQKITGVPAVTAHDQKGSMNWDRAEAYWQ